MKIETATLITFHFFNLLLQGPPGPQGPPGYPGRAGRRVRLSLCINR